MRRCANRLHLKKGLFIIPEDVPTHKVNEECIDSRYRLCSTPYKRAYWFAGTVHFFVCTSRAITRIPISMSVPFANNKYPMVRSPFPCPTSTLCKTFGFTYLRGVC